MAMQYSRSGLPINLQSEQATATTASTTAVFSPAAQIFSGSGGTFTVIPVGQTSSVTFIQVPAGTILPVLVTTLEETSATQVIRVY